MKTSSLLSSVLILSALGIACSTSIAPPAKAPAAPPVESPAAASQQAAPRAVILMIGDGMGISQITLARNFLYGGKGRLAMESFPVVGLVSTFSSSNLVTDSSASATAMATGMKADNKKVGVTPDGRHPLSLLDAAKAQGWKTGLVTTTEITHATPASFYASVENRYSQTDIDSIAEQLLEQQVDVAFGGGEAHFKPEAQSGSRLDDKNLVDAAREEGYTYWNAETGLPREEHPERVLGLFSGGHLNYELDRLHLPDALETPSLRDLAAKAIEILDADEQGYFLMIEGGRIDHAAHSFDAPGVVAEIKAFDAVVADVLAYQKAHPDVLVLLTADHATGGLAINDYVAWDLLDDQRASVDWMTEAMRKKDGAPSADWIAQYAGNELLTDADISTARAIESKYDARRFVGARLSEPIGVTWIPKVDNFETGGHTGEDVPIFAIGPGSERFGGMIDNIEIPRMVQEILGWPEINPER